MKPKYALEDLIYEMESRNPDPAPADDLDVYSQLRQKEQDLILAAELGQALLAKNEELQKQMKDLTEESNRKIELLEQERHISRRRLEGTKEECEAKITELYADIGELKQTLDFRETSMKQLEREKSQQIQDLMAQNQRLQTQLKERGKSEESLSVQLNSLRDQCNMKKSSLQDQESNLEVLRDEVQILTDRKGDLELRLSATLADRDSLATNLEESQERVRMLERHTREQKAQLRNASREIERLQAANTQLADKLDSVHSIMSPRTTSLLSEMECDEDYHTSSFSSLEKEVSTCYEALRGLCSSLRLRSSPDNDYDHSMLSDLQLPQYKVGMLTAVVEDLDSLLSSWNLDGDREIELHRCRETLDRVEKDLVDKNDELKSRAELIQELSAKLTMKEAELKIALEAANTARADLTAAGSADEQLISAREARDQAIARKAELELKLARARIDVLQANSQLMEAVQQKVELSQQLEQWQVDMQCLLDEQMKEKLTHQEKRRVATLATNPQPSSGSRKIFSFFR